MFATNVFRHLYFVKEDVENFKEGKRKPGDIGVLFSDNLMELQYTGHGGPLNSHAIGKDEVTSVTFRTAKEDRRHLKSKTVSFEASEKLPMGTIVSVKVRISPYIGLSPETDGLMMFSVELNDDVDASGIAKLIVENYKEQAEGYGNHALLDLIELEEKDGKVVVKERLEEDFYRGRSSTRPLQFDVYGKVFCKDRIKGLKVVADNNYSTEGEPTVGNGRAVANMEWFMLGDRTDTYREAGVLAMMPEKSYFVDPNKEYCIGNIHVAKSYSRYYVQKSEFDITFVFEDEEKGKAFMKKIKDFIDGAKDTPSGETEDSLGF